MTNLPDFDTTASVTGATLISQTDEEIRQLMSDVKSYQENVSYLLNNYTSEQIASGLASLESDVQDKINELLSVNPDGTYYTKTAIDNKINDLDLEIIDNLKAIAPFNGYFKKPDFIFDENVNNILKYKIQGDYFKVNDKVINTEDITIDMSSGNDRTGFLGQGGDSFVPHVEVQDQTTNGLIVQGAVKKGDYVVTDTSDIIYRATEDVPTLTDLTNTNYFETRDYISNQVASVLLEDGSIHNEVLINDVFTKDRYKALELNGWSKLENGLYSKGSMIGTGLSIWQTLNKFGYHPIYNPYGTASFVPVGGSSSNWYQVDVQSNITAFRPYITNTLFGYNNYTGTVANVSYRPDGKFYDIVYKDQLIDITTSCVEDNESVQEVRSRLVSEDGVSDEVGMVQVTQTTTGTVDTLEVDDKLNYQVGMVLQIWNGTTPYRRNVKTVNGTTLTLDSTIVKTAVPFLIGGGKLPILSSGTKLSTRLYGKPVDYPEYIKNTLASGKPILIEPILVSE